MGEHDAARIDVAARVRTSALVVTALVMSRGAEQLLRIHVAPVNIGQYQWSRGGWRDGQWSDDVWSTFHDRWGACAYWGPLATAPSSPGSSGEAKFCGQCGTARTVGARFCGQCGSPFGSAVTRGPGGGDVCAELRAAQQQPDSVAPLMVRLIEQHSLSSLAPAWRQAFIEKLTTVLRDATVDTVIDGNGPALSGMLTLAAAQDAADALRRRAPLTAAQRDTVRQLLVAAPHTFGYWGPLKTVFKHLDPAVMPEEFGIGLARLSLDGQERDSRAREAQIRLAGNPTDIEDLSMIAAVFDLPSDGTRNYMRRRMRRELAQIADRDPDLYVAIAASMLIAWDDTLTADSYLPGYVLLGDRQYMSASSRSVQWRTPQDERRDAHPHIWDAHLQLVERVRSEGTNSSQAFTFAVQVLHAAGQPIPELTAQTITRALHSTYPPLQDAAFRVLDQFPLVWGTLPVEVWESVFTRAATTDVVRLAMALQGHESILAVARAAARFLGREESVHDERLAAIASVYLAYASWRSTGYRSWWEGALQDSAAVTTIALVYGFDATPDAWRERLAEMDTSTVCRAYLDCLADARLSATTVRVLEDLITRPQPDWALLNLAYRCFDADLPAADALASRLLAGTQDAASARTSAWAWVWQQDAPLDRRIEIAARILQSADAAQASEWIGGLLTDGASPLTPAQAVTLLGDDAISGQIMWRALAGERTEAILSVLDAHPHLIVTMGNALTVGDVAGLSPGQEQALNRYLRAVPNRIPTDPLFGVQVASLPAPAVQQLALTQLEAAGLVRAHMLPLAECGLPLALRTVRDCVQHLRDPDDVQTAVLALVDSAVPQVRDLGLALVDERRHDLDLPDLWAALCQSDDPVVLARVAEEAAVGAWPESDALAAFDRRLLITRRMNRRAKEQVKTRVGSISGEGSVPLVMPQRLDALRNMAAGANTRDREWALQRLALLTLAGASMDDVAVTVTSGVTA